MIDGCQRDVVFGSCLFQCARRLHRIELLRYQRNGSSTYTIDAITRYPLSAFGFLIPRRKEGPPLIGSLPSTVTTPPLRDSIFLWPENSIFHWYP
jgi:hypothetical protein